MAKSAPTLTTTPTPAQRRAARRQRRRQERPLAAAAVWGLLTVFALGIGAFLVEVNLPNTPLHNLWNLIVVNGQVSPNSPLLLQLLSQVRDQDVLLTSFLCQFGGGLVLGRLAPRTRTRRAALWVALVTATVAVALWLALGWLSQAGLQGGHISSGQVSAAYVARQAAWGAGWVLAFVAGAGVGLGWRDRRHVPEKST